jgi:hypothetical protein
MGASGEPACNAFAARMQALTPQGFVCHDGFAPDFALPLA